MSWHFLLTFHAELILIHSFLPVKPSLIPALWSIHLYDCEEIVKFILLMTKISEILYTFTLKRKDVQVILVFLKTYGQNIGDSFANLSENENQYNQRAIAQSHKAWLPYPHRPPPHKWNIADSDVKQLTNQPNNTLCRGIFY